MATPAAPCSRPAPSSHRWRAAGKQAVFSQATPIPRTSGREHLPVAFCRPALGQPRTHLPPPAAPAPSVSRSPWGGCLRPRPRPRPLGSVPTDREWEASAAHLPRAAGPASRRPQGVRHRAQECLSDGCTLLTKLEVWGLSPPCRAQSQGPGCWGKRRLGALPTFPRADWSTCLSPNPTSASNTQHQSSPAHPSIFGSQTSNYAGPSAWKCPFLSLLTFLFCDM